MKVLGGSLLHMVGCMKVDTLILYATLGVIPQKGLSRVYSDIYVANLKLEA